MRATHGARGDIDGEPRTSQPSELSTEDGDKMEMMTRIATTLIPKKVLLLLMMMMMLMRQDHPVMGVMMMRDSWHLNG